MSSPALLFATSWTEASLFVAEVIITASTPRPLENLSPSLTATVAEPNTEVTAPKFLAISTRRASKSKPRT